MDKRGSFKRLSFLLCATSALVLGGILAAGPVSVRRAEGVVRGFLELRALDGVFLASGDLIQFAAGERVTSRIVFHFRDGSVHDETVVFSQRERFKLIHDHLVQKGATFPHPMDVTVDTGTGLVTVRDRRKDGTDNVTTKRLELPDDVANGLVLTLIKNIDPHASTTTVSMVATTPAPRLVKLVISPAGSDRFSIGRLSHQAVRYVVKVEIGGFVGALASLAGKKPPDTQVWVLPGEAPAFVRSEGPLYFGGPIWRIELARPVWPAPAPTPQPR